MKMDKSGKMWMKKFALLHASLIPSTRPPRQGPQLKRGHHSKLTFVDRLLGKSYQTLYMNSFKLKGFRQSAQNLDPKTVQT